MIDKLYEEQDGRQFPYLIDFEIGNVCLPLTDTYAAGAIHTYMYYKKQGIPIPKETIHQLEESRVELETILRGIIDEEGYDYFFGWYRLCNLILDELSKDES